MKCKLIRLLNRAKGYMYDILYIILLTILSTYVISNWEQCISMRFFNRFDGNNILFLVWIALFILLFYDVEAKGWKFHRKRSEDMRREFNNADSVFAQNQMNNLRNSLQFQNAENQREDTINNGSAENGN